MERFAASFDSAVKKILKKLAQIRPKFSIDSVTGEPAMTIRLNDIFFKLWLKYRAGSLW